VRAPWLVHDRYHLRFREQDSVRVAQDHVGADELFTRDDHATCRQSRLLGDAQGSHACARPISSARWTWMIATSGRHSFDLHQTIRHDQSRLVRTMSLPKQRACGKAGYVPRGRPQGECDREVRVIAHLERARDPVFTGAAVAMPRPSETLPTQAAVTGSHSPRRSAGRIARPRSGPPARALAAPAG